MSRLRMVIGRAGSGKTTTIYNELLQAVEQDPLGPPMWLIVPEQATFQAEHDLSRLSPDGGLMRIRVVSFKRLAHLVFQSVRGATVHPLSEVGEQMLMQRAVEEYRDGLKLFSRAADQPGFCQKLLELFNEMKRYRVSPQKLKTVLENQQSLPLSLKNKLLDLSVLYAYLEERYEQLGVENSESALDRLADSVRDYKEIRGAEVWIDGFTGFTPQEFNVLQRLMAVCDSMTVCLTLPPELLDRRLPEHHTFHTPWETAQILQESARVLYTVDVSRLFCAGTHRFSASMALEYLEKNYFNPLAPTYDGSPQGIALVSAANRRVEVESAAREIIRLCRDEGLRFKDICVVVRDFGPYEELLVTTMQDYDIPIFLDRKRPVPHHPVMELLRSSLEAIASNMAYEPMMRCLKTDLFPLTRDEVDRLDNYVLARGVRGAKWHSSEEWHVDEKYFGPGVDQSRRSVASLFVSIQEASKVGESRNVASTLYDLLENLQVEKTIDDWARDAEGSGDLEEALLHRQVYASATEFLQELVISLGDERLPLQVFTQIVNTGLENISLGLIPPGMDQVVVMALGRSRSPGVKAALVLGANEGIFPAPARVEGILSDEERRLLASFDLLLGPTVRRQVFEEDYLVYTALSRPSERLYVSYSLASEDGKALLPSAVVRRLQELFPALKESAVAIDPPPDEDKAMEYLSHPRSAAALLSSHMRDAVSQASSLWSEVHRYLSSNEQTMSLVRRIEAGKNYKNLEAPLPKSLVRRVYGAVLRGSVSRLERFNRCPFAYFAAYGLRLRERSVYKLAAPDIGNFFHEALDMFARRVKQEDLDWGQLGDDQYKRLASEITDELAPQLQSEILTSSSRYRYLSRRLRQTLERSAKMLGTQFQKGKFRPVGVEISFGQGGDLPAVVLELADGSKMELAGRIDRIDGAITNERLYLRVVDYKSGNSKLTPLEIYHGLKLQLLTYLYISVTFAQSLVDDDARIAIPAGALYFHVHDPLTRSEGPLDIEQAENALLKEFRPGGFVLAEEEAVQLMEEGLIGPSSVIPVRIRKDGTISEGDHAWSQQQYEAMRQHLQDLLTQSAGRISDGDIQIAPIRLKQDTACKYCEYKAVCAFDINLEENTYRELEALASKDVWQRLAVEEVPDEDA